MKQEDYYGKYFLRHGDLLPERIDAISWKFYKLKKGFLQYLDGKGLLFDNKEDAESMSKTMVELTKEVKTLAAKETILSEEEKAKKHVYISGPISGVDPEQCQKRFSEIEEMLTDMNYRVFNPLKNGLPSNASTNRHMRRDLNVLSNETDPFDFIFMMKRWPHSSGCKEEFNLAIACGIKVMFEESGEIIKFE